MLQIQQMDDRVDVTKPWFKDYKFHLVRNINQLEKLVNMCISKKICSLDLETTGVDNRVYPDEYFRDGKTTRNGIRTVDTIVGVCISFDGENGYYVPLSHEPEDSENLPWEKAWDILTRLVTECRIIFHNAKFDAEFLFPIIGIDNWKISNFEDTMLLARVLNPIRSVYPAGLKQLTKLHFDIEMIELDDLFTPEQVKQLEMNKLGKSFAILHPKEGLEYASSDGIFTFKLWFILKEKMVDNDPNIYDLEKSFCNVVRKMERNRVRLNMDLVKQLSEDCKKSAREIGDAIRDYMESKTGGSGTWITLNISSADQLRSAFLDSNDGMKLKPIPEMYDPHSDSSKLSLKDEAMKALVKAYPKLKFECKGETRSLFDWVLEYRHYDKMSTSFLNKFMKSHDEYGEVRPRFNQMGTDTARMSATAGEIKHGYSGVNFMGIPRDSDADKPELFKRLRECIIPRPGYVLVKIDYSGEELRVSANMSGEPVWIDSFLNGDGDVHSITTRFLYDKPSISKDERNRGKRCNFAVIYGGGAGAIARNVDCSMEDGGRMLENLRKGVPQLMGYSDDRKRFAKKHKAIYTAFGRRIPIENIEHPIQGVRRKAERCSINYTIQSTSADILKFAMCFVDKNIRKRGWEDDVRYIMTVHDEVVYEIRPHLLQESVRLLDEWMTLPWKLPKAHGREWVVPLETEPEIDISWRAHNDYFQMVDGVEIDPKDIDKEGNYTGELKKNQYAHAGRIYAKIPDFLEEWIKPGFKLEESEPESSEPESSGPEKSEPESKEIGPDEPEEEDIEPTPEELSEKFHSSDSLDEPGEPTNPDETAPELAIEVTQPEKPEPQEEATMDLGESLSSEPSLLDDPKPEKIDSKTIEVSTPSEDLLQDNPKVEKTKPNGSLDDTVMNWTLKSALTNHNVKKLQAVIILSEGSMPLKISLPSGKTLIESSKGVKVDYQEFNTLTKLFGLG